MKDKNFGCDGILSEKIRAIQIAVNQLWSATSYLLEHQEEIGFDRNSVFIAGNSAGGEVVLHAAYWNRNEMQLFKHNLEPTFKYAGLVAGAGAIMDLNLIDHTNMIPGMFFHGDMDQLVPYDTAAHHYCKPNSSGWLMLFGSYAIQNHIEKLDGSADLITFRGEGHDYHNFFFIKEQQRVSNFIERVLLGKNFMSQEDYQSKN